MKTSTKVTTTTKTSEKATTTVVVPAALKAAVKTVADSINDRVAAMKKEGASWYVAADALVKLYKTREDASPVLKQAFEDASLTDGMYASYRSNILSLAYPPSDKVKDEIEVAKKDGLSVHKVVAVARGSLKKSKKKDGGWIKVDRAEKRGGANKKDPLESLKAALALAITAAQTAKLDEDQIATALAETLTAAEYDLQAIGEAIANE